MALRLAALRRPGLIALQRTQPLAGQLRACSTAPKKGFWVGNFTPKEGADMEVFATNYRAPMIASLGPFGGKLTMAVPKPATAVYHGEVREKSPPCLGHSGVHMKPVPASLSPL